MWSAVEKMPRWKPRRDAKNTKIIKRKKSVIYHKLQRVEMEPYVLLQEAA